MVQPYASPSALRLTSVGSAVAGGPVSSVGGVTSGRRESNRPAHSQTESHTLLRSGSNRAIRHRPHCDGRSTEGRCTAAGGRVAVGVACVSSRPDFFDGAGGARGERGNGARGPAGARGAGGAPHRSQCPCRMRQSQTVSLLGLVGSRKSKRAEGSSYSADTVQYE